MDQNTRDCLEPFKIPQDEDIKQSSAYLNRVRRFKLYSKIFAIIVILLGVMGVLGWFFDIPLLRGEYGGVIGIKLNTTLLLILSGSSVYLLNLKLKGNQILIPRILGVIIVLVGLVTSIEYIVGINLGMNYLFPGILTDNPDFIPK